MAIDYTSEVSKRIEQKLPKGTPIAEVMAYLLRSGILTPDKLKIALVHEDYIDLIKQGVKAKDARHQLAEKYCVSGFRIEKYLYYYKEVRFR